METKTKFFFTIVSIIFIISLVVSILMNKKEIPLETNSTNISTTLEESTTIIIASTISTTTTTIEIKTIRLYGVNSNLNGTFEAWVATDKFNTLKIPFVYNNRYMMDYNLLCKEFKPIYPDFKQVRIAYTYNGKTSFYLPSLDYCENGLMSINFG
jgi:hypothetical protein